MDKNLIRKEIAVLIDSIKEHSDNIGNTKQISQLELEVILNKIEKLYEKSIIFNYLNKLSDTKPVIPPPGMVESTSKETIEKQVAMDLFASEIPIEPKPTKIKEVKASANKTQKKPITDLKAAIGINEKFQFINELFEGNMQEYNIAINQLDSLANLHEATTYINSLKEIYRWENETPVLTHFKDLLERRYSQSL